MEELYLNGGAVAWARQHPDDVMFYGCCLGERVSGALACTCWRPVFTEEQQAPRPPATLDDLRIALGMCDDCVYQPTREYRGDRAAQYSASALLALPADGEMFWCRTGMRRPIRWEHPDGRIVAACDGDYRPPIIDGVPYQVDGSPGLLCAGWALVAGRWCRG